MEGDYVSRAALKLASVADEFAVDFGGQNVLDIGSSTGGFTQFVLNHGAAKVLAVEVGKNQMHPSLRLDPRVVLFEQTDIRDINETPFTIDVVVADVSFVSLKDILPHALKMAPQAQFIVMVKPQFETGNQDKNKGIIKNDTIRRNILKDFEAWVQKLCLIENKADSAVAGSKGNRERFYLLKPLPKQR